MPSPVRPLPQWLRLLLAVAVLVSGLASLADTPVRRDVRDLVAGVQQGDVRVLQRTPYETEPQALRLDVTVGEDEARDVEWVGRSGLRYRAPVDDDTDLRATLRAAVPDGSPPPVVSDGTLLRERLAAPLRGTTALLIVLMLFGPQPRRATKWGWFWLLLLPWGLGAALLLAREAPWSRRTSAEPDPFPKRAQRGVRASGGTGFAVLVVVSLGVVAVSLAVGELLPSPDPAPGWELVRQDGSRVPGEVF